MLVRAGMSVFRGLEILDSESKGISSKFVTLTSLFLT